MLFLFYVIINKIQPFQLVKFALLCQFQNRHNQYRNIVIQMVNFELKKPVLLLCRFKKFA